MAGGGADYDVVVVGGGIAGLTAAYRLREHRVLVLEAGDEVGGRVKSCRRGPYWVNLGAQFLAGEGPLWELVRELGLETLSLTDSHPALALRNRLVVSEMPGRVALQLPLSLPARLAMVRLGLKLRRSYKRLARNPDPADARRFRDKLDQVSSSEYFAEPRNEEVQAVLRAFIRFWMGAEPHEVSAGHTALYIGLSVSNLREVPPFSLVAGGNQRIPAALADVLGERVLTRASVDAVRRRDGVVEVAYRRGGEAQSITARECIVAVPAYAALEIVSDLSAEQRRALEAVRYGAYVSVGFFTGERGTRPWDRIYAATVVDKSFQVVSNPATVVHRGPEREAGGALLVYAGGDPARQLLERDDGEIVRAFQSDLEDLLPGLDGLIEDVVVQRWPQAIPYWEPGGRALTKTLREPGERIHFAADYLAYPSMQVAATAGIATADAVAQRLAA
jgi:monoamine oxidase